MGRSVTFFKVNLDKVQNSFSEELENNLSLRADLIEILKEYSIDFQTIFDKICRNTQTLNPQEIMGLYYATYNYHFGKNQNFNKSIMENYVFVELFYFVSRQITEAFIQEYWNHFDPIRERVFISPDYLISKEELLDYLNWVSTLTATFSFKEERDKIAQDFLKSNTEYHVKALDRYNFEKALKELIENVSQEEIDKFYQENNEVIERIGDNAFLTNYFEIYWYFEFLFNQFIKIKEIDFSNSIVYISDSY